jgi:hypothetical protein
MSGVSKLFGAIVFTAALLVSQSAMAQTSPDFPTGGAITSNHCTKTPTIGVQPSPAMPGLADFVAFVSAWPGPFIVTGGWLSDLRPAQRPAGLAPVDPALPDRRRLSR